jgi:hypothetical protein
MLASPAARDEAETRANCCGGRGDAGANYMPRSSRSARIQFSISVPPCPDAQISYARRAISSWVTGLAAAAASRLLLAAGDADRGVVARDAGGGGVVEDFGAVVCGRGGGAICGIGLLRTSVRAIGFDAGGFDAGVAGLDGLAMCESSILRLCGNENVARTPQPPRAINS